MAAGGQPDVGDVHVDAALSNISVAHQNKLTSYVADLVFPMVNVDKQSDFYWNYTRGDFFADEGDRMLRAPGTRAPVTGFAVGTAAYHCLNYAIGMEIPDELRGNADSVFNLDADATKLVTEIQAIRRERAFAADFMAGSVWTGGTSGTDVDVTDGSHGGAKWNDYALSDPFGDIALEIDTVESYTGMTPNVAVGGAIVWRRLKNHPDFLARISGGATTGNPAMLTKEQMASMLEIEKFLVGRALYRSTNEGATVTLTRIIDDDLLLLYVPASPGRLTPAGGYTFNWAGVAGGAQFIRRYRLEPEKTDVIEAFSYFDQKCVEPYAGAFFSNVVD